MRADFKFYEMIHPELRAFNEVLSTLPIAVYAKTHTRSYAFQRWLSDSWKSVTKEAPLVWGASLFDPDFCNLLTEEMYHLKEVIPTANLVCITLPLLLNNSEVRITVRSLLQNLLGVYLDPLGFHSFMEVFVGEIVSQLVPERNLPMTVEYNTAYVIRYASNQPRKIHIPQYMLALTLCS